MRISYNSKKQIEKRKRISKTTKNTFHIVGHFEQGMDEFQKAWNTMCHWFTESGYQQGDGCTYELYHNDYTTHPEKKHIVDICIPVKPL